LSSNFSGKWQNNPDKESTSQKIKNVVNPESDLRKKLVETDRSLTSQIAKLDKTIARMMEKEKSLFNKSANAVQRHETEQARAYATELSEHKKAIKLVTSAKISIEKVQLRLKTITDFGDLANAIAPVGRVMRTVRKQLAIVMPTANDSLGEVASTLDGLMQEIGGVPGMTMNFDTNGEEAEKILAEASAIAETKMAGTLPTLLDLPDPTTDNNTSI
jgi:division protein CdvB (Snf7/Vps24/ESCRT-III family)